MKHTLAILSRKARKDVDPLVPAAVLEHELRSRANMWQCIHRLRAAGVQIRTEPCTGGDRYAGGYALAMATDDAWRALHHHRRGRGRRRLGFSVP